MEISTLEKVMEGERIRRVGVEKIKYKVEAVR